MEVKALIIGYDKKNNQYYTDITKIGENQSLKRFCHKTFELIKSDKIKKPVNTEFYELLF